MKKKLSAVQNFILQPLEGDLKLEFLMFFSDDLLSPKAKTRPLTWDKQTDK